MDISTIINLVGWGLLLVCLLIGGIIGFIRGLRKSIIFLISAIIMFVVFWIISAPIANSILGVKLNGMISDYPDCNTLEDLLAKVLSDANPALANENLINSAMNLVYMFTRVIVLSVLLIVGKFLWWIGTLIIWLVFFRGSKEYREEHKPKHLLGFCVGLGRGLISYFVIFIPLSGLLSVGVEGMDCYTAYDNPNVEVETFANTKILLVDTEVSEETSIMIEISKVLKSNFAIQLGTVVSRPLSDALFSVSVGGGDSKTRINFRKEVTNLLNLGEYVLTNVVDDDNKLNITNETVEETFTYISKSNLIAASLPIAIDCALSLDDVKKNVGELSDYGLTIEDIYDINWKKDIRSLGSLAGNAVEIIGDVSKLTKTEDERNNQLSDMIFKSNREVINEFFTDLSNIESLTMLIPAGADYVLGMEDISKYLPEDFDLYNGEEDKTLWWQTEIKALGNIFDGFRGLEMEELPLKDDGSFNIPKLLEDLTKNDNNLDTFITNIVSSRLVTSSLPVAFELGLEIVDKQTNSEGSEELLNYTNMTKEQWKEDFKSLVYVANDLYESKAYQLAKEDSNLQFVDINYDCLDSAVGSALTLNMVAGKQGLILDKVISIVGEETLPVDKEDIKYDDVTDWKNEGSSLVRTIESAAPILDDLNSGKELKITDLDSACLRGVINNATNSKIAVGLIHPMLQKVVDQVDLTGMLKLNEAYIVPDVEDWKKEGNALVDVFDIIKEQSDKDIPIALIKTDVDVILQSILIEDLTIATLSSLSNMEGLDMIVVPYAKDAEEWYDTDTTDGELRKMLTAINAIVDDNIKTLDELGNSLSIDTITNLENEKFDVILNSEIIRHTASKLIIDITDDNDMLIVPNDVVIDNVITKAELKNLLVSVKELDIVENNTFKTDLSILDNLNETVLESNIIHATLSNVLIGEEAIKIPTQAYDSNEYAVDKKYIIKDELIKLKLGIDELGIINDGVLAEINIGLVNNIGTNTAKSLILRSTISKAIEDNKGTDLIIPDIVYGNNCTYDGKEAITEKELVNLKNAIVKLNLINDSGNLNEINPGLIKSMYEFTDEDWASTVGNNDSEDTDYTGSLIIRYTLTHVVEGNINDITLLAYQDNNNKKAFRPTEIIKMVNSIKILELVDDENNFKTPSIGIIIKINGLNEEEFTAVLESIIVYVALSDSIFNQEEITIPYIEDVCFSYSYEGFIDNAFTNVAQKFIDPIELRYLANTCVLLGLINEEENTFNNVDVSIISDLSGVEGNIKLETCCASKIFRYALSDCIFKEENVYVTSTSYAIETGDDFERVDIFDNTITYDFIKVSELAALFNSITELNMVVDNGTEKYILLVTMDDFQSGKYTKDQFVNTIGYNSSIFRATISSDRQSMLTEENATWDTRKAIKADGSIETQEMLVMTKEYLESIITTIYPD